MTDRLRLVRANRYSLYKATTARHRVQELCTRSAERDRARTYWFSHGEEMNRVDDFRGSDESQDRFNSFWSPLRCCILLKRREFRARSESRSLQMLERISSSSSWIWNESAKLGIFRRQICMRTNSMIVSKWWRSESSHHATGIVKRAYTVLSSRTKCNVTFKKVLQVLLANEVLASQIFQVLFFRLSDMNEQASHMYLGTWHKLFLHLPKRSCFNKDNVRQDRL
jgi:hypothetical protein